MPVTVANALPLPYRIVGNQKKTVNKVTCSSVYVAEGELLTAAQLGLNVVDYADCSVLTSNGVEATPVGAANYVPTSGATAAKLKLINTKTAAELAAGVSTATVVVQVEAYGN